MSKLTHHLSSSLFSCISLAVQKMIALLCKLLLQNSWAIYQRSTVRKFLVYPFVTRSGADKGKHFKCSKFQNSKHQTKTCRVVTNLVNTLFLLVGGLGTSIEGGDGIEQVLLESLRVLAFLHGEGREEGNPSPPFLELGSRRRRAQEELQGGGVAILEMETYDPTSRRRSRRWLVEESKTRRGR